MDLGPFCENESNNEDDEDGTIDDSDAWWLWISKSGLSIVVIVSHFRRSFNNVLLFFLTPRSWNSKEEKFIPRDVIVFFSNTFGSCAIN
jgi:hypothetical protein